MAADSSTAEIEIRDLPQSQCIYADCARTSRMRQSSTTASTMKANSCIQLAKDPGNWCLTVYRRRSVHQRQVSTRCDVCAASEHCTNHIQFENTDPINSECWYSVIVGLWCNQTSQWTVVVISCTSQHKIVCAVDYTNDLTKFKRLKAVLKSQVFQRSSEGVYRRVWSLAFTMATDDLVHWLDIHTMNTVN